MDSRAPTLAEMKAHFAARAQFLQAVRDDELRQAESVDVVANILAVDGLVAMTASSQPERNDHGLQEQQRLFRMIKASSRG